MASDDGRPRGLDRAVVGKIEIESLLPGDLAIPGEETDPHAHGWRGCGG
jgi:hypothetical protein